MSISYSIRKWAAIHYRLAQGLIVVSTVLLFLLGHLLGILAESLGIDMYAMFLIGTGAAILAWTLAPRREENFPIRYSYARQKVAVVIMLTSMTIGIGGWAVCLERFNSQPIASMLQQKSEAAIGPAFSKKATGDRVISEWFHGGVSKTILKKIRKLFQNFKPKKKSVLGMVIATIACLVAAYLLAGLIMFLSCTLSCNGNVVFGNIVLIGGLGLLLFFLIKCLALIYRNPNNSEPKRRKPLSN